MNKKYVYSTLFLSMAATAMLPNVASANFDNPFSDTVEQPLVFEDVKLTVARAPEKPIQVSKPVKIPKENITSKTNYTPKVQLPQKPIVEQDFVSYGGDVGKTDDSLGDAKAQLERIKLDAAKAKREAAEKEKQAQVFEQELNKQAALKAEQERKLKLEQQRKEREDREKIRVEELKKAQIEKERIEKEFKEKQEREQEEARLKQQAEKENRERLEAQRIARLKAEAEAKVRVELAEKEQIEFEKAARLKIQAEQRAAAEAKAKLEAEQRAAAEAEAKAKLEAEQRAAEAKAKLEAEQRAAADVKAKAKLEAEQRAAAAKAKLEAEQRAESNRMAIPLPLPPTSENLANIQTGNISIKPTYASRATQSALQRATVKLATNPSTMPLRNRVLGYTATKSQIESFGERYKYDSARMSIMPKQVGEIKLLPVARLTGDTIALFHTVADKKLVEEYMSYNPLHAQVFSNYVKRIMTLNDGKTEGLTVDKALMDELVYHFATTPIHSTTLANAQDQYLYITSRLNDADQIKFWNWVNIVKTGDEVKVPSWVGLADVMYSQ